MRRQCFAQLGVLVVCVLGVIGVFGVIGVAPVSAATVWSLEMHHNQTNFPAGGTGQYWFDLDNIGSSASAGQVKLELRLPPGVTYKRVAVDEEFRPLTRLSWGCSGTTTVICTTTAGSVPRHTIAPLVVEVAVAGGVPEGFPLTAEATLSGGGAAAAVSDSEPTEISSTRAGFGILASSFEPDFFQADGITTEREAGGHPDNLVVGVDFTSVDTGKTVASSGIPIKREAESVRDLTVELPAGFVGNPTAVAECTAADFTVGVCPSASQVGRFDGSLYTASAGLVYNFSTGVFNMVHPRGAVTDLAFQLNGFPVHIKASLDAANNYTVVTTLADINEFLPPYSGKVTIWGVPADSSHDSERCSRFSLVGVSGGTAQECPAGHVAVPFISLPSQCETPGVFRLYGYDSWQNTGVFGPEIDHELSGGFTGCDKTRFEPEVSVEPTGHQADSPTGLNVRVHVPQNENPNGLATPPVKNTVVRLPEGMSFSPSFANGLTACSLAQMHLGTNDPIECPDSSRIGEVSLSTPLLPKPIEGSIYLAAQYDNPFGSLFAIYLVLHDTEERGVLIKLPGKVETNPITGQITTTFSETPQLPFEDLTLKFRSGARAPLVNPPSCGAQDVGVQMSSWAQPNNPVDLSSSYQVSEGANGQPCPEGGQLAFSPRLSAGTVDNVAGSFSPLNLRISRQDGEQEITGFSTTLPPGVTATLTGLPFCPEADIAAARSKTGGQEEAEPSCPPGSQIGRTIAEAGVGTTLAQTPGKLYMAGPFEGAPFSIVSITSAKVGPYDLGTVVVHLPLFIDPRTAMVTVGSGQPDQIPHIIDGVIVHLRNIRVYVDRPNFTLNPTSCERLTFTATVVGSGQSFTSPADDRPVTLTIPFQAADCASLAFKPSFKVSTSGKTSKANGASLTVKLAYPSAPQGTQANIHLVKVELPKQLPSRLTTLQKACTAAQFDANPAGCPAASVIGHATAITPILPVPLTGPAYFVSNGGEAFPNLIMVLQGYGITIDLVGDTFISKAGITSSTFKTVPDQPVSSFELTLPQGPYSALTANGNLCTSKLTMPTEFVGQNGATFNQTTPVSVTGCPKVKVLTRVQRLALALKACHKKPKGAKRKACERQARKKYGPVKTKKRKK